MSPSPLSDIHSDCTILHQYAHVSTNDCGQEHKIIIIWQAWFTRSSTGAGSGGKLVDYGHIWPETRTLPGTMSVKNFFFFLSSPEDIFLLLWERKREREEGRERDIDVRREKQKLGASCICPDWGSNLQPRHGPWQGLNPPPVNVWDDTPTYWTTLAIVSITMSEMQSDVGALGVQAQLFPCSPHASMGTSDIYSAWTGKGFDFEIPGLILLCSRLLDT